MTNPFASLLVLFAATAAPASPVAGQAVPQASALETRPFVEGRIYSLVTAPGQISSIALEPGEGLISVAAGDTAQWVIADTTSGSEATLRSHILIKPVMAGLRTNLLVTTDRRTYQLILESRPRAPLRSLRWTYAEPGLIAVRPAAPAGCQEFPVPELSALNFGYRIEGAAVPWRPLRAFDDGRRTFIEFPPAVGRSEAPPLFINGPDGKLELVNYRVAGRYYVVDRIFSEAELRIGERKQRRVRIIRASAGPATSPRRPS